MEQDDSLGLPVSKRQKKGLAASELMKPPTSQKEQSYISQKFSAGTVTKKDEIEDRLVGLISPQDRELLALAEKNQYIALKGQSVNEQPQQDAAAQDQGAKLMSTQEQLADVLNPKQQKELTTIMQFKHSNDSKRVQHESAVGGGLAPLQATAA